MSRTFREWNPDQNWLFPPSPQDWLPDGHLVYFLIDVSEQLDLSPIMEKYDSEKGGKPPYPSTNDARAAAGFLLHWRVYIAEDRSAMRNGRGLPRHRG